LCLHVFDSIWCLKARICNDWEVEFNFGFASLYLLFEFVNGREYGGDSKLLYWLWFYERCWFVRNFEMVLMLWFETWPNLALRLCGGFIWKFDKFCDELYEFGLGTAWKNIHVFLSLFISFLLIFVGLSQSFGVRKKRVVFVVGGCYSCIGVGNCEIYDSLFIDYHSRVSLIHRNDQTALDGSLMQKWQQKDLDQWQTDMWTKGQKSWTNKIKMKIKKINNKKRK